MRLNWFSPLPPAPTGAAGWAAHVLPVLCARADVVLWTDQDDWELPPGLTAAVRRFRPDAVPWAEVQRADLSVYHLVGDPRWCGAIGRVSREHPGVVVLYEHDPGAVAATEGALGVLVHTRAGHDTLRTAAQWPLAYQPLDPSPAPESYVEALLRLCEEARRRRTRPVARYLAGRAAAEVGLWAERGAAWMSEQVARPVVRLTAAGTE